MDRGGNDFLTRPIFPAIENFCQASRFDWERIQLIMPDLLHTVQCVSHGICPHVPKETATAWEQGVPHPPRSRIEGGPP
jgi:hypothetical protein